MAVIINAEFTSPIAPAKLFKVSVLDAHKTAPKAIPQMVKSGSMVGDGGVGSVKEYHFFDVLPFKYLKERVDVLDEDNFACTYSLVEGGYLGTKVKSTLYHVKYEVGPNGGSICKMGAEIDPLDGIEFSEEELEKEKEAMVEAYKSLEAYALANPDA